MNNRRDFIKFMLLIIDMPNKIFASSGSKTLVVYYLHTLNTHILASYIQHIVGADMLKLETFDTYLINYDQMVSLAAKKQSLKKKPKEICSLIQSKSHLTCLFQIYKIYQI
ncbi:hypothetical protein Q4Y15_000989 [Campylobacter fetus]|uniref:Uncharacterized protein n=2 Tax=Campylobacter fetus TaxID=196 RepID=A0A5L8JLX0_CAMFE|nr:MULTISPECIES: hypothetical protein [Campylobacter]OCS22060.1 hypothetical protein CFVI97532_06525 [Campylobacter fetus subsp. venerealis cfvi97/532]OCS26403.1 hypothetical protein CFVB10_03540 [Campylobacter fetus subsp. venerealis cfvB10]OCS29800.1 hypothetical protein CFVCCUG33900_03770 [Campylobacter fetus subsp. venerealis LMG 6570 = CCUG 33900]OCS42786.1 hypothetical protein CFVI02298_03115 [Campylobacter fetus subsp. venerealis cfvi02/298]AHE95102.1 hypothetical protein CFVI03293_1850